jgi:hypothetical protein
MVFLEAVAVEMVGEEVILASLELVGGSFYPKNPVWALPFRFQFG